MRRTSHIEPEDTGPGGRLGFTNEGLLWLGISLILGLAGWYKSLNLVLILAYAMATLLVVNGVFAWWHARRVQAVRPPVPPLFAGETGRAIVVAHNVSTRPATVGITDRLGDAENTWLLHRFTPDGEVTCTKQHAFPARGRFSGAPLVVWSAFPFGLLKYERSFEAGVVVVLPKPGEADAEGLRRWLARQAGGDGRSRKVLRRVTTDQADLRGVRPYRPGDSIRTVHWRSSARRGSLMVREYDAAPSPELVLVVEPWLPAAPTAEQVANLESALSLATTITRIWVRSFATRITVVVSGKETAVHSGPPTESFLREALAPLADAMGLSDFAPIPPDVFERSLGHSARVVVSSRRVSPLAGVLLRSTGRHFQTVDPTMPLVWYRPPAAI